VPVTIDTEEIQEYFEKQHITSMPHEVRKVFFFLRNRDVGVEPTEEELRRYVQYRCRHAHDFRD